MSEQEGELRVRRILVPVDASPSSLAALQVAAQLAAMTGAELAGLFVEDINLLRLTGLPCVRQVSRFSPEADTLSLEQVERQLRVQAAGLRRRVAASGQRQQVAWSFQVARGPVAAEVLAAAAGADLVIVGRTGWTPGAPRRIGSTVQALLRQGRGMTFVLQERVRADAPVVLLWDGSLLAGKALAAAVHLARARQTGLTVLLVAAASDQVEALEGALERQLSALGVAAFRRRVVAPTLERVAHLVQLESSGPVVVPAGGALLGEEEARSLVDRVPNPVLLVR